MENNLKNLQSLLKKHDDEQLITNEEFTAGLTDIINAFAQYRSATASINRETRDLIKSMAIDANKEVESNTSILIKEAIIELDGAIKERLDKLSKEKNDITGVANKTSQDMSTSLVEIKKLSKKAEKVLNEVFAFEFPEIDKESIVADVLSQINIPEYKEITLDDGDRIVQKINQTNNKIKREIIEGVDKFASQEELNRAIEILDQRSQFLINRTVKHDSTLSGEGTDASPLSVVGGGGGGTPALPFTSVQFNNSGSFGGSATFTWNGSTLMVNPAGTPLTLTQPTFQATNSTNNFTQSSIQNKSNGTSASADLIAYPDNNTNDTTGFADIGVTSSGFSDAAYAITSPNDGYFFVSAVSGASLTGRMVLATDSTGTSNGIALATGGFNSLNNIRMNILGSKAFVSIGQNVTPAARLHIGSAETAAAWTTNGIAIRQDSATWTDSTSSGTVAEVAISSLLSPTLATASVTTYTTASTLRLGTPTAGTNVTITNGYSLKATSHIQTDGSLIGSGGIGTSISGGSIGTSGNFYVAGSTLTNNTGAYGFEGSTNTNVRAVVHGGTTAVLTAGNAYADLTVGGGFVTEAASGNHPLIASVAIKAPTITGGVATVSNTATVYIEGAPSATVTGQNYSLWVKAGISFLEGDVQFDKTITAGGTTGAQTINKTQGSVNFAATNTTLVVTNSLVTTNSIIMVTVDGTDTTFTSARVTKAAGSFTITANAAATAETRVDFIVFN